MTRQSQSTLRVAVRHGVVAAASIVIAIGVTVLAGWALKVPALRAIRPDWIAMIPNTAVGFIISGSALLLFARFADARAARIVAHVLALFATLLGVATLLERAVGVDLGIDLILFADSVRSATSSPAGRMAVNSALGFTLTGLALLLLGRSGVRARKLGQLLALTTFFLAFLALLGYAYRVDPLYTLGQVSGGMAMLTAISFAILSLGVFFARADGGLASLLTNERASGVFSRRLAPAAILVPVVLGWLWLVVHRERLVDDSVGIAVLVVLVFALYLLLLVRSARAVERLDTEREALLEEARQARADAEAANRAKMQFLTSMSHELRTPLNAIAGYVQLLEIGVHGPLTDAQRDALARTRRSQQHLLALINDVLNFAKLDAGRVEFRMTTVPMHEFLTDLEALILPQLGAKSLHYDLVSEDDRLAARADRDKLQQILVNLLSNAIKFTPSGGSIIVGCEGIGNDVHITVRDTGIGIAREALDTIFEPFIQVDRSLTNLTDGAGLGLAISRELARGMHGELRAESTPGVGSTFTLTLRRAAWSAPAAPAHGQTPGEAPHHVG